MADRQEHQNGYTPSPKESLRAIAPSSTIRRVNVDQSDLNRQAQTRNGQVRYVSSKRRLGTNPLRETTDQAFVASYAKQGLQPSSLEDIRPEQTTKASSELAQQTTRGTEVEYAAEPEQASEANYAAAGKLKLPKNKGLSLAKTTAARTRAVTVTTGIWSWAFFSWIFFQLPFAILSLVFLGLALAIDAFKASLNPTQEDGMVVASIKDGVKELVDMITWVASKVLETFGVDLSIVDPMSFFTVAYMIVLAYGLFLLILIYMIYMLAFLRPLSGVGDGMKKGFFLLALVGYSVPILNLFPWFFLWTLAVLRFPK